MNLESEWGTLRRMVAILVAGLLLLAAGGIAAASASPLQGLDNGLRSAVASTEASQAEGGGCSYERTPLDYADYCGPWPPPWWPEQ